MCFTRVSPGDQCGCAGAEICVTPVLWHHAETAAVSCIAFLFASSLLNAKCRVCVWQRVRDILYHQKCFLPSRCVSPCTAPPALSALPTISHLNYQKNPIGSICNRIVRQHTKRVLFSAWQVLKLLSTKKCTHFNIHFWMWIQSLQLALTSE